MKIIARNKKALFDYSIIERFEAGIVLKGSEVVALRAGRANLKDSFVRIIKNEICIGGILGFEYGFLVLFIASILTLPFFIFFRIKAIKEQELAMIPFLNIAFVAVLFYKNLGLF